MGKNNTYNKIKYVSLWYFGYKMLVNLQQCYQITRAPKFLRAKFWQHCCQITEYFLSGLKKNTLE